MANLDAWRDRDTVLSVFGDMSKYLRLFMMSFKYLQAIKTEILDNPERCAGLKEILDEDPIWSIEMLTEKFLFYKEVYDWLKER